MGPSLDLSNYWSHFFEFPPFPSLWFVEQFPPIYRSIADQFALIFNGIAHYGSPHAWLTFGHDPLNFCRLLASDWLSSFRAFADNYLIGFSSNLVGRLTMDLSWPHWLFILWSCSTEFPPFHVLWLVEQLPHIWWQTANWIELKFIFGELIMGLSMSN